MEKEGQGPRKPIKSMHAEEPEKVALPRTHRSRGLMSKYLTPEQMGRGDARQWPFNGREAAPENHGTGDNRPISWGGQEDEPIFFSSNWDTGGSTGEKDRDVLRRGKRRSENCRKRAASQYIPIT